MLNWVDPGRNGMQPVLEHHLCNHLKGLKKITKTIRAFSLLVWNSDLPNTSWSSYVLASTFQRWAKLDLMVCMAQCFGTNCINRRFSNCTPRNPRFWKRIPGVIRINVS